MAEPARGAVAAGHPEEVAAALRILAEGGNAVDAVVAGAFCACVVEPNNAGLAGYGHLTAWLPGEQRFLTVDHGPRAPAAATADLFRLERGERRSPLEWPAVVDDASAHGALATGVPGAVAGLCAAHARAGRLPLAQILEPAIETAEAGHAVEWYLSLVILERLAEIRSQPAAAAHLLHAGDPPGPGHRLDTSALARTLRRIAREGSAGFHGGSVAEAIAREVAAAGGILSAADIAGYAPRVLLEQPTRYRGRLLSTAEDDVGHLVFGLLSRFDLPALEPGSGDALHLLAEVFGHAFADAVSWSGDPAAEPELSAALRSEVYADSRARAIDPGRAAPRPVAPGSPLADLRPAGVGGSRGTTQVAVADGEGGMAVVITTIGQDFGGLVWVPEVGVLLNSAMSNFDPRPGRVNSIAPERMPLFGVPATIAVEDGRAVLACGGSGGYRILASVVQATVNVLDHGLEAGEAVRAPRVWCQGEQTFVDARVDGAVRDDLVRRGHDLVVEELTPAGAPFARVSLVTADAAGDLAAASDPAWHGAAETVTR
ncbi:MAG: gamma-glutamyltranspeptidase / glutathione hydrolase [Gaiellaceae bacterium]|nr:gamma-glutamyltranspeptidase / glutathione hydrolase [Gaiellaceae bacterium]